MLNWKPLDDTARDGRDILLRVWTGHDHRVEAAYYGLAQHAVGVGATKKHPWVLLDPANGVNHRLDDDSLIGYVSINELK